MSFAASILKRGLRLFEKKEVQVQNIEGALSFQISNEQLTLTFKDETVFASRCSCGSKKPCEHIAAALFYVNRDQLTFSVERPERRKTKGSIEKVLFDKLTLAFKKQIRKFSSSEYKYGNEDYIELIHKFRSKFKGEELFLADLIIFVETSILKLSAPRYMEPVFIDLIQKNRKHLLKLIQGGATPRQKRWLASATLSALRSNAALISDAFVFLLPWFLVITSDLEQLQLAQALLAKRKRKRLLDEKIDPLEKARLQIEFRIAQVLKDNPSAISKSAEEAMAMAELYFLKKQLSKGFKVIENATEMIRIHRPDQYLSFLDQAILLAHYYNYSTVEISLLRLKIVAGLFVDEASLKRYKELTPLENRTKSIDELLKDISKQKNEFTFEKLSFILASEKRWRELYSIIKREPGKFPLLHRVALNLLPEVPDGMPDLYGKKLAEAVREARYPEVQKKVIDLSGLYILRLSLDDREKILVRVFDQMGYRSQIAGMLSDLAADN